MRVLMLVFFYIVFVSCDRLPPSFITFRYAREELLKYVIITFTLLTFTSPYKSYKNGWQPVKFAMLLF